jgi:hypothetical protein
MTAQVELDLNDPTVRARLLRRLHSNAKGHARTGNMLFDLPDGYAEELYRRQKGRCAVSGFQFSMKRYDEALVKHPFAPSLDRISSKAGYRIGNVRLVCTAVNFGMGQWGDQVYMTLAREAVARELKDRIDPDPTDAGWADRQREKIEAAEDLRSNAAGPEQEKLRRQIASLKRALSMGPGRLREAARKARETIQRQRLKRLS